MQIHLPTSTTYGVWSLDHPHDSEVSAFPITEATESSLPDIEHCRPGYSSRAREYMVSGHHGILLWQDNHITGMAWHVTNESARTVRTKGYYPLLPGRTLFHADWIHPEHRGQGLHRVLISSRLNIVSGGPATLVEANIEPDNRSSIQNYERLGFILDRTLTVVSWRRWAIARYR